MLHYLLKLMLEGFLSLLVLEDQAIFLDLLVEEQVVYILHPLGRMLEVP